MSAMLQETAESDQAASDARVDRLVYDQVLGPLKPFLDDRSVLNIDVNDDGGVWVERWNKRPQRAAEMSKIRRRALIEFLASTTDQTINADQSRLQCDLPYYHYRVQAMGEPVSGWTVCIRIPVEYVPTIGKYVSDGILDEAFVPVFEYAARAGLSIVVAGDVNTGKSTFLNMLLALKANTHGHLRPVIIQDRREVRADGFANKTVIMARVGQQRFASNGVRIPYLYEFDLALEDALRSNGGFIVWSEVRDPASAYALLLARNSGGGSLYTTVHATNAAGIPHKFAMLAQMRGEGTGKIPAAVVGNLANLLVCLAIDPVTERRRVVQVATMEVVGDGYRLQAVHGVADLEAYIERDRVRRIEAIEAGMVVEG